MSHNSIYKRFNRSIHLERNKFIDSLVEHIKLVSTQLLEQELNEIKVISDINDEKIICSDEIKAKEITADELDNIYFIGKHYQPPFKYYINDGKFVIEIKIYCEIVDLNIDQKLLKQNEEFLFIITGQKKIVNDEESDDISIVDLINKRFWKNFKIEFKIKIKDFEIDGLEKIDKNDDKSVFMEYGILYINFNVE